MTPLQAMYHYAADRPQTDPVNDRLGYRSFSQQLAKGIQNVTTPPAKAGGFSGYVCS
jgi:hypothetical protein